MIAIVFIFAVVGAFGYATFMGAGPAHLPWAEAIMLIGLFLGFFGAGVHVGAALGCLGLVAGFLLSDRPFWLYIGQTLWTTNTNFVLVSVPLFLLMGEVMLRAGLSNRLYSAMGVWLNRFPGGLLHTNIASCAVFSAISGSSVATAATMGSVALPYFRDTHHNPRMVLGSLAAGGALGNLIPPGITFIVYALITETSVGALYVAAIGPALLVVVLFTLVILVHGWRHPAPPGPRATTAQKWQSLLDLIPTLLLMGLVLGTIYTGVATPTESAAFGVVGALALGAWERKLSWPLLRDSLSGTALATSMIGLILLGAYLLNFVLASVGVPQALAQAVGGLPFPPWVLMLFIIGFYIALGTFMEGFSMIVTTIPVIFPLVKALGYDPIWFGVIVTMLVEIAMISPPDGTILYVLQGMRQPPGPIEDVFAGVMPFLAVYILAVLLLLWHPGIALWLV
ncbi:TRAP transporter large permease [Humitalea sp. 24SJ18S-53]|uniref:TRAP transporter large permease n=1 Tax=Humitalea sp. 24SJ18S-53 TaxID=3422307 RepID=UPI003D66924B